MIRLAVLFMLAPALIAQQRIISTTPSITEILFALGLGDRVVGVSTFCRYPEQARKLPKIGTFLDPHLETMLQLRPDLVIVQNNPVRLAERLQAVKLRVLEVNNESMEGVHRTIIEVAEAAGVPQKGRDLSARIEADLRQMRERTAKLPKRRVVFIVGRTPETLDGLIAAAKGSYLSELLEAAGGINIFHDAISAYPKIAHEELIARNPEVLIDMGDSTHRGESLSDAHKKATLQLWKTRFPLLRAVKENQVYPIADDRFVVPGPRMAEAVRLFATMLHPGVRWN
ncbi:MAG TPA: helical backbone metal receptor [Bryobacteraceae bacterium]|nr:helical backbone metal receptor [Bryobacteraceae bacterium]